MTKVYAIQSRWWRNTTMPWQWSRSTTGQFYLKADEATAEAYRFKGDALAACKQLRALNPHRVFRAVRVERP